MNLLSLYFGNKGINVINAKAKNILNNFDIPASEISSFDFEDKVPADLKMVALLQEAFRAHKLTSKEAVLCLSGTDLIVRTFDIPQLPREELESAINFEAKKYLPFRIEELVTTFQVRADNVKKNNLVIFMAIKKDILSGYLSIASQLKLKIRYLEYSALSLIRLLKVNRGLEKTVTVFIYIDSEGDESHFMVLEDGFLLYSRDITLSTLPTDALGAGLSDPALILDKMKAEIKSSLDYYQRRFSLKPIIKTVFFSNLTVRGDLNEFLNELGLKAKFIDLTKGLKVQGLISSGAIKSYAASLANVVNIGVKLDLFKVKSKKQATASEFVLPDFASFFKDLNVDLRIIFLAIFLVMVMYIYGLTRILPLKDDLKRTIALRPNVAQVNVNASYEELIKDVSTYKKKLASYDAIVRQQVYLTKLLNGIPRFLPKSAWLSAVRFTNNAGVPSLKMQGYVYLDNQQDEIVEINKFLNDLRADFDFSAYFKKVALNSISKENFGNRNVASFEVTCQGLKGEE